MKVIIILLLTFFSISYASTHAKQGSAEWHYIKGAEELTGFKGPKNRAMANEHFKRAAEMGYAPGMKALADSYFSGDGIDKDIDKALFLYMQAADMGDGAAQFNLGIVLMKGYTGVKNLPLALYYLTLASVNPDLDEVAQDAAIYRDECEKQLTPEELQEVYRSFSKVNFAKCGSSKTCETTEGMRCNPECLEEVKNPKQAL